MGSRILDFPAANSHVPKVYETTVYSQIYKIRFTFEPDERGKE